MDRISSGIVDIICAQTRARAASDKLYETQRVQSGVERPSTNDICINPRQILCLLFLHLKCQLCINESNINDLRIKLIPWWTLVQTTDNCNRN